MSYIKIKFHKELGEIDRELQDAVADLFRMPSPALFSLGEHTWRPAMDVYENPEEILVVLDLAGVQREDIHLETCGRTLRIQGRREQQIADGTARYRLAEIPFGTFDRRVNLPVGIDADSIEATYKDGLLTIRMTKTAPEGGPARAVRVKS